MTINAGLGLGEGVVSGTVDVDCIQVKKPPGPDLQFRYRVGDKRELVVPDVTSGHGTRLVESQYHQRLRPALEYTELCDLARAASILESAYGEPLDIEFAWEDQTMYILQARPIIVFHAALRDTFSSYPLRNHPEKESQP
jgi:pyruvate,water dikinase